MAIIGEAYIAVKPQVDQGEFESDLSAQVEKPVSSVAKKVVAAAAAGAVTTFFKGGLEAAREARAALAQTEKVIETTGGAANVSVDQVLGLANELSMLTGVHDEVIQAAENMLLTFTNVRNEVGAGNDIFDQATATALDIAAAMGTDATQEALRLGKALNDPIRGVSALAEVGVTFTDQQREMIQAMVDSGDTLGAQQVILAELGKEFGGQAEAQADAADLLAVRMDNLQQIAGDALLPVLDVLATVMSAVLDVFTSMPGPVQKLIVGGVALAAGLGAVAVVMESVKLQAIGSRVAIIAKTAAEKAAAVASKAFAAAQWLINAALTANPIGLVIVAIAALVAGLILAYQKSETFRAIVQKVFEFLKNGAVAVLDFLRSNWPVILAILTGPIGLAVLAIVKNWDKIKAAAVAVKDFVVEKFTALVGFFKGMPGKIASVASGMWDGIKEAFRSVLNWIIEKWNALDFTLPSVTIAGRTIGGGTIGVPDIDRISGDGSGYVPGGNVIPRLGSGGIVRDPTLAIVGDRRGGEAVVGLDQLPGIIRAAFSDGFPGRSAPIAEIHIEAGARTDGNVATNIIRALRDARFAETGEFSALAEAGVFA